MISVLLYHVLHIAHCLIFPRLISDMLPARNLRKHQKTQFVAAIQKIMGLGVMGSSDRIQSQLLFQNIGIHPLHGFRHGISHIRITLMPVQPQKFYSLPIQVKAVSQKYRSPKTKWNHRFIYYRFPQKKLRLYFIQNRIVNIPKRHAVYCKT